MVEEITKDKKVICFKMRRRKNSKRTKGHRRELTVMRITDIIDGRGLIASSAPVDLAASTPSSASPKAINTGTNE